MTFSFDQVYVIVTYSYGVYSDETLYTTKEEAETALAAELKAAADFFKNRALIDKTVNKKVVTLAEFLSDAKDFARNEWRYGEH